MGQQQLLLLVLGIVIVGLAVVVGIQAFSENQDKSRRDAMTNDLARIASDIHAYTLKPASIGGGEGLEADEIDLEDAGYNVDGNGIYNNANASYDTFDHAGNVDIVGCNIESGLSMVGTVSPGEGLIGEIEVFEGGCDLF